MQVRPQREALDEMAVDELGRTAYTREVMDTVPPQQQRTEGGQRGGLRPTAVRWSWNGPYDSFWIGVWPGIGEAERAALQTFQYAAPLEPTAEANRTEVDITKQVMTLYEGHQVKLITTVSTGSGPTTCSR